MSAPEWTRRWPFFEFGQVTYSVVLQDVFWRGLGVFKPGLGAQNHHLLSNRSASLTWHLPRPCPGPPLLPCSSRCRTNVQYCPGLCQRALALLGPSSLETAHCKQHTTHCTVHTVHSTLHTTHFTLHIAHYTLNTEHCTLHTANRTANCHASVISFVCRPLWLYCTVLYYTVLYCHIL